MLKTKKWSGHWKASKKPVKQRRYSKNAPKHLVKKFLSMHLSKDLRKKYSTRNLLVRKGDKIKVMRGEFASKEGRVSRVDYKRRKVYAENVDLIKRAGAKAQVGLQPSNLMIIELNLDDKRRMQKFTSKEKK